MTNYCSNCGVPISGNVKFCPECGTQIPDSNEDSTLDHQSILSSTQVPNKREDKLYFQGKVGVQNCKISSINWYIGDKHIIPVTSVSSVSFYGDLSGGCLGWPIAIVAGMYFFYAISNGGDFLEIFASLSFIGVGIFSILYGKKQGEIIVKTHSDDSFNIPCKKVEATECLKAMNQSLQDNR